MYFQQKVSCSLQLFFKHSGKETLTLAKWQGPELAGRELLSNGAAHGKVLAEAGTVGMGKDKALRADLEDIALKLGSVWSPPLYCAVGST